TRYQCSTVTGNKIFAIRASDKSIAWTINYDGVSQQMDFGSEGCSLDYDNNYLFCGTNQPSLHYQNTLWVIDTTNTDGTTYGTIHCGVNADSIRTRPMFANGKTY